MNQASKIVSDALLGMDFKNVEIGGVVYTIKPPTIKVICRAIHHFSNVGMEGDNIMEAIKELPEATEDMLKGISCFICGNDSLVKELENGTFEEVKDALDEERVDAGSKTETVGNTTFFGQIAHLIDTLHLSYTEVFEVIPYRNLLMMQRDKLHAVYGGQKVNRISGKELANRRKKK